MANYFPRRAALAAAAGLALIGGALTACSSDDGGGSSQAQNVLYAINILDSAGLHEIDESINNENEIPGDAVTVALRMRAVVALTEWPSDLEDMANRLEGLFGEMHEALDADNPDMAKVKQVVADVHDVEHDLSHAAWEYLLAESGLESGHADTHN